MPVFRLGKQLTFPPPYLAEDDGLLAIGGDLSPERLLLAYRQGIFPWYSDGLVILWYSPDPRLVLLSHKLYINRSLRKFIRKRKYRITLDRAFEEVITNCAEVPRPGQNGTWISPDIKEAYIELHKMGYAHSVEAWSDDKLVGGAYGVCVGGIFCGESMFTLESNASKVAFASLVHQLHRWGIWLTDCQVYTRHLARLGAEEWPRSKFLRVLREVVKRPDLKGVWELDPDLEWGPQAFQLPPLPEALKWELKK